MKFLSREPKKTMNFVRDIAIPVILLLSVGAIIISVNGQLTHLITLGGQNDILIVRNTQKPIEQGNVPAGLIQNKTFSNIEKVVPLTYQDIPVTIKNNHTNIETNILVVIVNISLLNEILPFRTITDNQIANLPANSSIIGSQIVNIIPI